MKLVFKLLLLIIVVCFNSYGCKLDPKYEYLALSAPVSVVIKELGLISQVSKLGSFHPFDESVEKVDGGIFLRAKNLKLNEKSLVFYDESKALNREFKSLSLKLEKIVTRNLSAIMATEYVLKVLNPYLIDCTSKVTLIKKSLREIESSIQKHNFLNTYLFYLGSITSGVRNNLIIVNDGFLLDLKKNKSFSTYPSSFAYVSWSSKVLKELKSYINFGVESRMKESIKTIDKRNMNLYFPGVLVPGLQQVKFLNFLVQKLKDLDQ